MEDDDVKKEVAADGKPKKRTFRKYSYRGVDLDALLDMSTRFQRGLKRKPVALIKKLRKAKKEAPAGEKPEPIRTHVRNMIIVPEMIGSIVGVYNGKYFNQVEIKPEMIGHYLRQAWKARYRCYPLLEVYSSQVKDLRACMRRSFLAFI